MELTLLNLLICTMYLHMRAVVAAREYHAARVALTINSLSYATAL